MKSIAVAGMGRSGIGVALAAAKRGIVTRVFDEKSADTEDRIAAVEQLEAAGVEVITGWHGRLAGEKFDALVPSPGFRRDHPAIRDALAEGAEVVSEVEFAYRISKAPIIAITGTNGKSTTTVMTWLAIQALNPNALLCGNLSGSGYPELTLTEAADRADEDGVLVAEVSSFQLEWVTKFRPKAACVTTVTMDHLDRHPTFQDYFDTKMRIFSAMEPTDIAAWHVNEPTVPRAEIEKVSHATVWEVPSETPNSLRPTWDGTSIELAGAKLAAKDVALAGTHNISNALMALTLASAVYPDRVRDQAPAMLAAIAGMESLQFRMQDLGTKNGVRFINNSMCTNPGAVIASSKALDAPQILIMGGVMKGMDFSPVGEYLRESGHRAVLFTEFRHDLATQLGIESEAGFEFLEQALDHAISIADPGDVVMLAPGCASAYPHTNFRERGMAFQSAVEAYLQS
jgi:UDP-N-acetylmuramoylalanine--D-glutamate ligase